MTKQRSKQREFRVEVVPPILPDESSPFSYDFYGLESGDSELIKLLKTAATNHSLTTNDDIFHTIDSLARLSSRHFHITIVSKKVPKLFGFNDQFSYHHTVIILEPEAGDKKTLFSLRSQTDHAPKGLNRNI